MRQTLPYSPTVPIAAHVVNPGTVWECVFDRPLQPTVLDPANWFVRVGGQSYNLLSAFATGNHVLLSASTSAANPGPDVVSFSPPPFDVMGQLDGVLAPAFENYPIT